MNTVPQNIIIGRFQIVHKGHAELFKKAYAKVSVYEGFIELDVQPVLTVGIGVSGKGRTKRNPFTYHEVKGMIEAFFKEEHILAYNIIPIRDINNPPCYANHVYQSLLLKHPPEQHTVYSNNEYLLNCLEDFTTRSIESPYPEINATKIRRLLAKGSAEWRSFVPQSTISYIENVMHGEHVAGYLCRTCEDIR